MRAKELIEKLVALVKEHGDLEPLIDDGSEFVPIVRVDKSADDDFFVISPWE